MENKDQVLKAINDRPVKRCQAPGCIKQASVCCPLHQKRLLCSKCKLISHCQCDTHVLIDEKQLLEDAYLLKKFIDRVAHVSEVFNMQSYHPDFQGELSYFIDEIDQIVTRTEECLIKDLYVEFEGLQQKVHSMKKTINMSKMYIDHCVYINTQEFNDLALPPSQQLDNDQDKRHRLHYTNMIDEMHTRMLLEKESEVQNVKDAYKEKRKKLRDRIKELKQQSEADIEAHKVMIESKNGDITKMENTITELENKNTEAKATIDKFVDEVRKEKANCQSLRTQIDGKTNVINKMNYTINKLEKKNKRADEVIHELDNQANMEKAKCQSLRDELEAVIKHKDKELAEAMEDKKRDIDKMVNEIEGKYEFVIIIYYSGKQFLI